MEGARSGAWDILIGTQALFRREALPQHGLVGVLQADSGLHVPDFEPRSAPIICWSKPSVWHGLPPPEAESSFRHVSQRIIPCKRCYQEIPITSTMKNSPHVDCFIILPPAISADLSVTGKDRRIVEDAAKQWGANLGRTPVTKSLLWFSDRYQSCAHAQTGASSIASWQKDLLSLFSADGFMSSVQKMEREYRKWRIKFVVDIDPIENG